MLSASYSLTCDSISSIFFLGSLDVARTLILIRKRCRFRSICIFLRSPSSRGIRIATTAVVIGIAMKTYLKTGSVTSPGNWVASTAEATMPNSTVGRAYLVKYRVTGMSMDL